MSELFFEVSNSLLEKIDGQIIEANFEEMKTALTEMVQPYKGLIVTEDAIPMAKADRAKLNKVIKSIDDYRKNIKKTYMQPYEDFKDKCDDMVSILKEAEQNIGNQIKEFDAKRAEAKMLELFNYFVDNSDDVKEYINFADIENQKWANVTYEMDNAKSEIDSAIKRVRDDVAQIDRFGEKYTDVLKKMYSEHGDIGRCFAYLDQLKENDERQKREEQARIAEQSMPKPVEEVTPVVQKSDAKEEIKEIHFTVLVTKRQAMMLRDFLVNNGITYR